MNKNSFIPSSDFFKSLRQEDEALFDKNKHFMNHAFENHKDVLFNCLGQIRKQALCKAIYNSQVFHEKNINLQDSSGNTILHHICEHLNQLALTQLMTLNPDVNIQNHKMKSALMVLCENKNQKRIDLDNKTIFVSNINLEKSCHMAVFLLDQGAKVHLEDNLNNHAIYHAINNDNVELVKALMQKGSDIYRYNHAGETYMEVALSKRNEQMIQTIFENLQTFRQTQRAQQLCLKFSDISETSKEILNKLSLKLSLDERLQSMSPDKKVKI